MRQIGEADALPLAVALAHGVEMAIIVHFNRDHRRLRPRMAHPPGHAQADFVEAIGVIGGVERKIHCQSALNRDP